MTWYTKTNSPVGDLLLIKENAGLRGLHFDGDSHAPKPADDWCEDRVRFTRELGELEAYFAGSRTHFDVALDLEGTPFQRAVWAELRRIPHGKTRSYGEVAKRIRKRGGARAVGSANARNPVSIIVPCHRVIGSDGSLTGYAGGEARKRFLLELEAATGAAEE